MMKGLLGGLFKKKPKRNPIEIKAEKQLKQIKDVRFVKVWSTALDDCVCQECAKLEGVSVPSKNRTCTGLVLYWRFFVFGG